MKKRENKTEATAAMQAYTRLAKFVEARLERIRLALVDHQEKASSDPRNNGSLGDLEHVQDLMGQVEAFLTNSESYEVMLSDGEVAKMPL